MTYIVFWIVVMILSIIVEAITAQLVSIWFAVGSLGALIAAILNISIYIQVIIFFVLSGIILFLFLKFGKKRFKPLKIIKTNYDRIIGEEALVTADINMILGTGQITVLGQDWGAITEKDDDEIFKGEKVKVVDIKGVKAVVKKL